MLIIPYKKDIVMKDFIDSYLTPLIHEERKEVILDCVASFEKINYVAALDELNTVCQIQSGISDNAMLLSRIDDIIRIAQDEILNEHLIKISDEATQAERQAVVNTLLSLEDYIIPDEVNDILLAEYSPEETLAHLVELIDTSVDFLNIIDLIESVSPTLISNITSFIQSVLTTRGQAYGNVSNIERINLINRLIRIHTRASFKLAMELVNAGLRVGKRNIDDLLQISFGPLDAMTPIEVAKEIVGLVLISNTEQNEISRTVMGIIDDFTSNNIERSIMENEAKKILNSIGDTNEIT